MTSASFKRRVAELLRLNPSSSPVDMAVILDCQPKAVFAAMRGMRVAQAPFTVRIDDLDSVLVEHADSAIIRAAVVRGISPDDLINRLMGLFEDEPNLIDAVLDDQE